MASGGSVPPGSISLGCDQIFDRNCSMCERKGKIKEAVNYCTACLEYFCQKCLDFHNTLPALKDHQTKLLGKSTMLKSMESPAKVGSRDTITTMCEDHSGRLVEMFCEAHDVVCCNHCVLEKHWRCNTVKYIPKVAGGFSMNKDGPKLKSDLQTIKTELTSIKTWRREDQTRIQQERDQVLTQIKDARRKINVMFDKLETSVTEEAQQRYRNHGWKIQTDLDECDNAVRRIETAIKAMDNIHKDNQAQLFVEVKKGYENLGEFRALVEQIQERLGSEQIKFHLADDIETYIARLETLGTFVDAMMVKMEDDSNTCNIHGSCCLPDGGALLSDYTNNKLKRLDSSYRVTDRCSIKDPYGVCYISTHTKEAAVCQSIRSVHIVSVGRTMTVIRSIKTNHECYGVSYNNGQLYVGENGNYFARHGYKVHVYDFVSGAHKSTIHTDRQGQRIFSGAISHIATSSDGTRIWVADMRKGLIQLGKSGNYLRTITDDELRGAYGVCLGRDNSVLVCGYNSRTVLQLSPDGEKISTLVRADKLPAAPQSISYDKDRARLLVTMYNCDHVKVFHLK